MEHVFVGVIQRDSDPGLFLNGLEHFTCGKTHVDLWFGGHDLFAGQTHLVLFFDRTHQIGGFIGYFNIVLYHDSFLG